ncbi:unnamed protein product, partial [Allacma fusca]
VLPCLHTFCESCLIAYLPPESLTLTCPECRQQSILPEKGISALQTNFCVTNLSMDKEVEHRCSQCGQLAKFKCHDCDLDMCESCSKSHPKSEEGSNSSCHQVSPLSNGVEPSENGKSPKTNGHAETDARYLICPSHAGQTLRFFCRDCDTAVCSSCTDIEHGRHTTVRAMDAVHEEKIRLKQLMENVHEQVGKLQEAIGTTEKASGVLFDRKNEAIKEINTVFEDLFEKLKGRKQHLLDDVDVHFTTKMEQIQKARNVLTTHLKDVKECCLLTEKAISHENETEILFVKKQIGERLEDYAKMDLSPTLVQIDDSLEFEGLLLENLEVQEMGRVVSSLHKSWAVSGEAIQSRCVAVGKRHFLRLHLSANHSPHLDVRLEDIHVQSSTKDCVFSLEQPRESDNRSFIIRFLVSRVGSFYLSVMVKNQHISGSPFQFHAYEADERSSLSPSPVPHMNGSSHPSPTSNHCNASRIPRANGASVSPRSRVSTPTKKFYSNGHIAHKTNGSIYGHGSSSRRSNTLEDDLILKIGQRGRNRGEFTNPQGVASTLNGRLVVTDSNNQCVQIFDNTGECKLRFGVRGRTVGQLQRPVGVAVLPTTGNIAIADYDNKWISIFDPTGKFMSRIGHGKLLGPKGLTVDSNGLIYVVDNKASCILIFQPNGKLLNKFGSRGNDEGQFAGPHFIAVNSKGNIIITDFHNHCVKVFDQDGDYLFCFGTNGEGNGQFNAPTGVAVDNKDNILVADWGNSRIQIFDSQGSFLGYVSTSIEPLYGPQGLTVTSDGYVAIADSGNHCIKLYKYS